MNKFLLTTLALLMLLISACSIGQESDDTPVLARAGGQSLTLQMALNEIPQSVLQQDSIEAISNYVDQWINQAVTVQHAEHIGLDRTDEFNRRLQRQKNQLLEQTLKDYLIEQNLNQIEVSTEEAQTYYQTYKDQFTLNEKFVRYRHITTNTRTDADNANRALMRGEDWRDIVNEYSINPDLQFRQSQQFWPISLAGGDIPIIRRYLNRMGLSERSPIFIHGGQYHLIQLMEERPAGDNPNLDWLIPQIEQWLKLEKARRITNSYVRNLYLEASSNNEIERANVSDIENILSGNRN
ncbi:peptidylprolyl isomerase [Rhodohalobacter halophilus]|uniref:peptidylprolyl isomerase n=1 Tax=Rhodohalobacter halophilus TaxID=1812810 RepID=UPI0015B75716|nr:peptidyl-prolyl cis-trans isomerase [Rhodohalobacter halophilus]